MPKVKPFSMERFLRALADETRLRILNLIRDQEVCVCYFVAVLDEIQPKVSRHLAYLRNSGLVRARREGKWMHYSIIRPDDAQAAKMLRDLLAWMETQPQMRADRVKMKQACCAVPAFAELEGAPRPARVEALL